jgi:hypothetical protein
MTNVDFVDDDYDSGIEDAIIGVSGLQIGDDEQWYEDNNVRLSPCVEFQLY